MFPGILWRTAAVVMITMAAAACGDHSTMRNPAGPAAMNGPIGGGTGAPGNGPMGGGTGAPGNGPMGGGTGTPGNGPMGGGTGMPGGGPMGPGNGPMGPGNGPMGPGNGPMGPGAGGSMLVTSEFDYLTRMIPHHEEAIEAAGELARSSRPEMREFGQAIIATQSAEVAQMKTWLASWYPGRDTSVDYRPMMRDLTGLTGDALDRTFLEDMIPHHMMAVMMSQQLINRRLAVQPPVVPFATNIRDTQQAEIHTMRTWLYQWFGV